MFDIGIFADQAGYIYVSLMVSYSLFGFFGGVLQSYIEKRVLIIMGYISGFIGFSFIAHKIFIHSDLVPLIIVGLFINGFSVVGGNMFATMWTKSELMDVCIRAGHTKEEAGAYFGGIKGSMNLIGAFMGPLASPTISMVVGFEMACITMGTVQILFVTLFIYSTQEKFRVHQPNQQEGTPEKERILEMKQI